MYIIGGLVSMFLMAILIDSTEAPELSLIKRNLGEDVSYLGMDRAKRRYVFAMPFGKQVDADKLAELLTGFLGKRVECEFDRYLYVQVFYVDLPTRYALPPVQKTNDKVIIGKGRSGFAYHNFLKYPHMIVAGHTGYGKTNFINTLITQLDGEVAIIDMKDGDDYQRVTARNLDEASTFLTELQANIKTKRDRHLYVIVDEAAQFVPPSFIPKKDAGDYFKCQRAFHDIATLGRSRKIHLIYCTQYPTADVVPGHIKQNCETRVVFRLPTQIASGVALDEAGAESLPAGLPGRALYKNDKLVEIQTFSMPKYLPSEGGANVVEIRDSKTTGVRDIIEVG